MIGKERERKGLRKQGRRKDWGGGEEKNNG